MKKTPFTAAGEREPELEFNLLFPSRRRKDFDINSAEASVLRIFSCLPADYISPELFSRILGPDFPLGETLEKLAEREIIKKDENNDSYLLCSETNMEGLSSSKEGLALISLISAEMDKAKKQGDYTSLNDWLQLSRLVLKRIDDDRLDEGPSEENLDSEIAASLLNSSITFCNVIVAGEGTAIGLKYDEENMFAPMIIFLEKGASAEALLGAAVNLGVPVVKNNLLAKNLSSYGKAGSPVPEASYRDVSLALARSNSLGGGRSKVYGARRRNFLVEVPRPISLEMGEALYSLTAEKPGRKTLLTEPLEKIRMKLVNLLGFNINNFRVSKNSGLKADEYRILFKGLEAGQGRLELGWYAGSSSMPEMMLRAENTAAAAAAAASLLIRHVDRIIRMRSHELLGRDEVDAILEAAEEKYPVVCAEVKSLLSLGIIREILQSLVSENVSIRHIAVILETLADWCNFGPAPSEVIVTQIRLALKRQICMDYTDDNLTLRVLTLEPELEKRIAEYNPENEGEDGAWLEWILSAQAQAEKKAYPPVILCSPRIRFSLKEITRREAPYLAVLSYGEVPPDIKIVPLGDIGPGFTLS